MESTLDTLLTGVEGDQEIIDSGKSILSSEFSDTMSDFEFGKLEDKLKEEASWTDEIWGKFEGNWKDLQTKKAEEEKKAKEEAAAKKKRAKCRCKKRCKGPCKK